MISAVVFAAHETHACTVESTEPSLLAAAIAHLSGSIMSMVGTSGGMTTLAIGTFAQISPATRSAFFALRTAKMTRAPLETISSETEAPMPV